MIPRRYQPGDIDSIERIFRSNVGHWFAANEWDDLQRELENFRIQGDEPNKYGWRMLFFVFEKNQEVIALGGYTFRGELCELSWGMVLADYHKTGLGKFVLQHRLAHIQENHPEIQSIVIQTSPAAEGFFAKFGFEVRLRQEMYWGGQIDLVGMELSFDGTSRYQHPDLW
jgi:GNAT superfamily N-acetyltransferase